MVELRRWQFPAPSAPPGRLVTLSEESTSLLFGRLLQQHISLWQAHLPGLGVIRHDATAFEQYIQRLAEATTRLKWELPEQLSVHKACDEFKSLLKDVPDVESIICSFDGTVTNVWTYLDSNPFDTPTRYRIYQAEQQIIRRYPGVEIEFHLINLAEYPPDLWAGLRATGTAIHRRRG